MDSDDGKAVRWWAIVAGWIPLFIFLPAILIHAFSSWSVRNYRIAALAIPVFVALIVWYCRSGHPTKHRGRQLAAFASTIIGFLVALVGGWFVAIPLYLWGGLFCILGWVLGARGNVRWPTAAGFALLLGLAFPWPLGLLESLSSELRIVAAWGINAILDGISVANLWNKQTVEMTDFVYTVSDRLHGLDGFLPLVLLAAFWGFVRSRSFSHTLALIVSAVVWLTIGYMFHGLFVIVAKERYSLELDSSKIRYGVGGAVFIGQVVLLFLSDLVLARMTERVPVTSLNSEIAINGRMFNAILAWPQPDLEKKVEDEYPRDLDASPDHELDGHDSAHEEFFDDEQPADWSWKKYYWVGVGVEAILVVLAILVTVVQLNREKTQIALRTKQEVTDKILAVRGLPSVLGDMNVVAFNKSTREEAPFSEDNPIQLKWGFEKAEQTASLVVTYPVRETSLWKATLDEDTWDVGSIAYSNDAAGNLRPGAEAWSWMKETGTGEIEGHIYVWTCGLQEDLSLARSKQSRSFLNRLGDRLSRNVMAELLRNRSADSVIGIRLSVETGDALSNSEAEQAQAWFNLVRDEVRKAID